MKIEDYEIMLEIYDNQTSRWTREFLLSKLHWKLNDMINYPNRSSLRVCTGSEIIITLSVEVENYNINPHDIRLSVKSFKQTKWKDKTLQDMLIKMSALYVPEITKIQQGNLFPKFNKLILDKILYMSSDGFKALSPTF